jgi:hypothetical protein
MDILVDTRAPGGSRKVARLRGFPPPTPGQHWPGSWPGQPGPTGREPGPFLEAFGSPRRVSATPLGEPLCLAEVAELIGYSPWTVRQTLIPKGLPHFRSGANGRLIFYRDQVIRWIENQQGGKQ